MNFKKFWAPREPESGECCGQGCVPCVKDLYEDELAKYRQRLALVEQGLPPLLESDQLDLQADEGVALVPLKPGCQLWLLHAAAIALFLQYF